jgi:hypothetical protein
MRSASKQASADRDGENHQDLRHQRFNKPPCAEKSFSGVEKEQQQGECRDVEQGTDRAYDALSTATGDVASVRQREIDERPDRYDAGRIDVTMAAVIVPLYVIETYSLGHARHLIEIAQIVPKV